MTFLEMCIVDTIRPSVVRLSRQAPIGHHDFAGLCYFTNCSGLCQWGIWPILTYPLSAFERFASIHLLQDNAC